MFFNSPATYSQQFAFSADGLCNMISKNSRQNMQLEDDLNYGLDYEYYENHAHLLKRAGDRWYRYDENGNLVCEQDRDFDLTDGTEAVEYHAVTKEAGDVYSTDYAWAAVRDSSAGKTEDDRFYKRTFEWNEDNMLIATTDNEYVTNYVYGADGERAVKKSKAGETLYFNKFFSHRFLGSIQWEAGRMSKHIFLGNERIATKVHELSDSPDYDKTDTRVEKENIYFYHSDHLGSAQTVTNGEGQLYERLEYTPYGEVWLDESAAYVAGRNDFKTPFRFTAKELDEETGLYYYGARYLDPKYSRWISTDPALAEYIPSAPINDEAKKRNQNLPGMGGVFNTTNSGLYHYAANNPVKYTDPDGRILNVIIGAAVGFVTSAASEIGERMINGQGFKEAISNTFTDKTSLAVIGTSTLIGAATSGVSGMAVKAATASAKTVISVAAKEGTKEIAKVALKTTAINTVSGAVDAGIKDVSTRAIKGQSQDPKGTFMAMGNGALSAAVFSAPTEAVIAAGAKTSGTITNFMTKTISDFKIYQADYAGSLGIFGESVLPAVHDVYNSLNREN